MSERSPEGAHAMPLGNSTNVSGRNPGRWYGRVAPSLPDSARERTARIQRSVARAPSGLRSLDALRQNPQPGLIKVTVVLL